jgi:hypothetical protein
MAEVATRVFPAIGPPAYKRYCELISRLATLVSEGREYSGMADELPSEVELLSVGAAESLLFIVIDAGRAAQLPKMMPEILFSVMVPFIGPDRAAEEMRQAATAL